MFNFMRYPILICKWLYQLQVQCSSKPLQTITLSFIFLFSFIFVYRSTVGQMLHKCLCQFVIWSFISRLIAHNQIFMLMRFNASCCPSSWACFLNSKQSHNDFSVVIFRDYWLCFVSHISISIFCIWCEIMKFSLYLQRCSVVPTIFIVKCVLPF